MIVLVEYDRSAPTPLKRGGRVVYAAQSENTTCIFLRYRGTEDRDLYLKDDLTRLCESRPKRVYTVCKE